MIQILSYIGLGILIAAAHIVVLLIAYRIWRYKPLSRGFKAIAIDIIGIFCTLLALIFLTFMIFDENPPSADGNYGTWFLIYAVVTLGIFPAITLFIHFLAGRWLGRLFQKRSTNNRFA